MDKAKIGLIGLIFIVLATLSLIGGFLTTGMTCLLFVLGWAVLFFLGCVGVVYTILKDNM